LRQVEEHNGTSTTWPYWLLPLAALAGLGWYLMSGDQWRPETAEAPTAPVTDRGTARPSLVVGGVDVGRQTTTAAESVGNVLRGIKDQASAQAALPKLQEAARELDKMATVSGQLPQEARTALASTTSGPLTRLNAALDAAARVPGVAPTLQPTLDQVRGRIDMIAMAPPSGRPYFAAVPGDWVLLSSLLNREVSNASGERLGTVNEVLLGPDGRMAALVVGVGRDLGFGEKVIAIPFNAARMQGRANDTRLVIDATKESLGKAPAYEPKR
jgi:sporulation protein YlmC with PRC-barrel domain